MTSEARNAPAAARNREPILSILRERLPQPGFVLEVASGTGEHAIWFSKALPTVTWQPSDRAPEAMESIAAWRLADGPANMLPPLALDAATADTWPLDHADAIVSINMIHISPWSSAEGLMAGAAHILPRGGILYIYGPFREGGVHTAASNADFDASLQARDPAWGVRDLDEVIALARRNGIDFAERIAMPASNLSVIFRKR